MVNNSTDVNKKNNNLSPQLNELKKKYHNISRPSSSPIFPIKSLSIWKCKNVPFYPYILAYKKMVLFPTLELNWSKIIMLYFFASPPLKTFKSIVIHVHVPVDMMKSTTWIFLRNCLFFYHFMCTTIK